MYVSILEKCPAAKNDPVPALARGGRRRRCCGAVEKYLCYDCLNKTKWPAKVQPLPGSSTTRTFEQVKVDLRRCAVCETGEAVYR